MYCTKCGKEIADDAVFCPYCGVAVATLSVDGKIEQKEEVKTTEPVVAASDLATLSVDEKNEQKETEKATENAVTASEPENVEKQPIEQPQREKKLIGWIIAKNSRLKFNGWKTLKSVICLVCLLLIGFLPVATVEGISIGNFYGLILQKLKKVESVQHLSLIFWLTALCMVPIVLQFILALSEVAGRSNIVKTKMIKKKSIVGYIVSFTLAIVAVLLAFSVCSFLAESYRFTMITPALMVLVLVCSGLSNYLIDYCALKKLETRETYKVVYKGKGKKSSKEISSNIIAGTILTVIIGALAGCVGYGAYMGSKSFYVSYDKKIYAGIDNKYFEIGKAEAPFTMTIGKKDRVKINWASDSTSLTHYGNAYHYYNDKLEELKEEWRDLKPSRSSILGSGTSDRKVKALMDKIDVYTAYANNSSYSYERLNFDFVAERVSTSRFNPITFREEQIWVVENRKRAYEYMYDALPNSENQVKWGKSFDLPRGLIYRESIKLAEYDFEEGTDFSKTPIVATVKYGDGSVRISVIKPSNLEELNTAQKGQQTVRWSDSWGTYEATINII